MSAPYDGRLIANLVLDLGDRHEVPVTQMVLLKIIYFSHGWYLARTGLPFVKQQFEAWRYGPVVKVVRDSFKDFGSKPITARAKKLNIFTNEFEEIVESIHASDLEHVEAMFRTYSKYNGWALSDMTHEHGSPWDEVWNSSEPIGRLGMRIRNEEIRSHFVARLGQGLVS
ncbi:Panacea domain-containing protein [Devosia aquimaris]|uniref:Panacea domain-containing protein n=1 Tax=Devosia aquimaris TaxID=2866214 RepID=UPI001CD05938|nr:type II toxin-antitoxin system antitoxin SocA domain-containing protein [Devosia sp. CJK-A8-3]